MGWLMDYRRKYMRLRGYFAAVILTTIVTLGIVWIFKPAPQVQSDYYKQQFDKEVDELRRDIQENVLNELILRHEAIDTITTNDGVNADIRDFRDRVGRLPNTHRQRHDTP